MNNVTLFLAIVGMGLITFSLRLSFIEFADRIRLPNFVHRGLVYAPVAIFCAIICQDVIDATEGGISLDNARIPAALLAVVVAKISGNVFITLLVGMIAYWLLQ